MEVAQGEEYARQAFESYFFAADVVVGVLSAERCDDNLSDCQDGAEIIPGSGHPFGPSGSSKDDQPLVWEDVIIGFYYVRFFPGRHFEKTTDSSNDER